MGEKQMTCKHEIRFEIDVRKTYAVHLWDRQDGTKKYIDFLEEEFTTGVFQSPFCLNCDKTWSMDELEIYKKLKEMSINE